MTLPELALAMGVLGIAMALAAQAIRHVRNEAKHEQTRDLLNRLDQAVGRYREETGDFPPGRADLSSSDCLGALRTQPAAWAALEGISPLLVAGPSREPVQFHDGWGTPLRYLTAQSPPKGRRRVEINANRPVFLSAGLDRDFGDRNPIALTDNLATDDL